MDSGDLWGLSVRKHHSRVMGIRIRLLCVSSVLAGLMHSGTYGFGSLLITMMEPCSEQPQEWCRVPLWCVLVINFLILYLSLPISSMAIVTVQIYHTTLLEGHPLSGHACWKWSPEVIFPPRATSYSPPFFSRP